MVNQVVLAVGLGLITGLVVVLIYLLVQFLRHRSPSKPHKYSKLVSEPNFKNRAIVKHDIPQFYIPQPVPVQQQQPITVVQQTESIRSEEYRNGRSHLSPTVRSVDVRTKFEETGGINLNAINTGAMCSPPLAQAKSSKPAPKKWPEKRKPSPPETYQIGTPVHQRKVAVHKKRLDSNLGKLEFSLYYDQSFRLLQIYVTRGIKIANSEDDISPDVLVIASLTFNESQIWEQKTKTVKKTNDPQFNEKLEAHNIIAGKLRESLLHFQLFDDRTNKLIGEIHYSLKEIPSNKLTNQTLPLVPVELEDSEDDSEEDPLDTSTGLGDLLISLCHNPTDQKLTVKIKCARSLQPLTSGRLNPFVKLDVTFCGKRLSTRSTKVAQNTRAPNFEDVFVFDMHTDKLPQVTLIFKVKHRGRMREVSLGTVHLGYCVNVESEYRHWEQVMEKPHLEIAQWHTIQEHFVE